MQGLRLGTRGSPLALAQARKVAAAIETSQRWPDGWVQIVEVKTTGDKVQDRPLAEIGGKGLWTKELDRALLEGEATLPPAVLPSRLVGSVGRGVVKPPPGSFDQVARQEVDHLMHRRSAKLAVIERSITSPGASSGRSPERRLVEFFQI